MSREIWLRPESLLVVALVFEVTLFTLYGRRFSTWDNWMNILRHSAEIGLLAVALTPIIWTGGIDLSVGSTLGVSAVVFGLLWRDAGMDPWLAGALSVGTGTFCGAINGALIVWIRIPPLIVTLGTYSLFRGLAEAFAKGVDTFTGFPEGFLFLGSGKWIGIPVQIWIFFSVALIYLLADWRTILGRNWKAIGCSTEAAYLSGIHVRRYLFGAYLLAGTVAGVAAITYSSRLGSIKADAGSGYELLAITAVALGGVRLSGGKGSVLGATLGVLALGILSNGLGRTSATMNHSSELAGVLTGALLIGAIALSARRDSPRACP